MPDGMDCIEFAQQTDFTSNFEKEEFNLKKEISKIGKSIYLIVSQHK